MIKYVLKRLLLLIPVILGVILIIFTIMYLMPGDPGRIILGENASQEAVDQKNEELGYYDPFFVQFFNYLKDAITKLDFGESYRTSKPVFDDVFARIPNSLKISFNGILGACIIGIPLGIL